MTLADDLRRLLGAEHVTDAPADVRQLGADLLFAPDATPGLAAAPGTVEELAAVVSRAYEARRPLVARGAAWSYTRAHVPTAPQTVVIDMRRLNRVVEVDTEDLFVTVETGCTWRALHDALAAQGLRAPFWGPLSGHRATIGGTLAQDAIFFGSAAHGTAARSVLGLDIVRSDGSLLGTGARSRGGVPWSRTFGPDLTGPFLGDAGTLGIKARATLAVVPLPEETRMLSFAQPSMGAAVSTLAALARSGLASELVAFDEAHHSLLGIDAPASLHATLDAHTRELADGAATALRAAAGGTEIAPTVPELLRGDPFGATRAIFGSVRHTLLPPVNAILPPSGAVAGVAALEELRTEIEQAGCELWTFATAVGRNEIVLEPSIHAPGAHRERGLELRDRLATLLDPAGAAHLQFGKYYPYASRLTPTARRALAELKASLDPAGLFNPLALGL